MPVQNPGVTSLFALHNLHKTERAMGVSIERLSSGKRINHAGDDAAGGAIADRMTAQIKGLKYVSKKCIRCFINGSSCRRCT